MKIHFNDSKGAALLKLFKRLFRFENLLACSEAILVFDMDFITIVYTLTHGQSRQYDSIWYLKVIALVEVLHTYPWTKQASVLVAVIIKLAYMRNIKGYDLVLNMLKPRNDMADFLNLNSFENVLYFFLKFLRTVHFIIVQNIP